MKTNLAIPGFSAVLLGVNGIGKTTQTDLLVDVLKKYGFNAHYLKYPIYNLGEHGPFIYNYLHDKKFRQAHPITGLELQEHYMLNRQDYESTLRQRLASGECIIMEDYTLTGVAWGMVDGVRRNVLERLNAHLLKENLTILLYADKRFTTAIETNHRNEVDEKRIADCANHLDGLADRYGCQKIKVEGSIKTVHAKIISVFNDFIERTYPRLNLKKLKPLTEKQITAIIK